MRTMRLVRTIGTIRARAKIGLQNVVYNIRRLATLERMAPPDRQCLTSTTAISRQPAPSGQVHGCRVTIAYSGFFAL